MERREYRQLHAEWYELRSGPAEDQREEIDFWARQIAEAGEPALELGCGTGRILVHLLKRGLDVVGVDSSRDMLARCIAACEATGLKPDLHEQSMLRLDIPRAFGLIFLDSGGLGLFVEDDDIDAVFRRVMNHLKPGGRFIYEFEPVRERSNRDGRWQGDWVRGPDGVVMALRKLWNQPDSSNVWEQLYILDKYVDGRLVCTEANERTGRFFTVDEAVRYAQKAGLEDIRATHWLTSDPPREDSAVITVCCRKPTDGQGGA